MVVVACAGFLILRHWLQQQHPVPIVETPGRDPLKSALKIDTNPRHRHPTSNTDNYLAYYPHGGFHTQRVALENALALCRLLDRTLLLPPLWIGRHPRWDPYPILQHALGNTTKTKLDHCRTESHAPECQGYDGWSQVNWDWLVTLEKADVEWIDRWDFSDEWLFTPIDNGGLDLEEGDVYYFPQDSEFHDQITESEPVRHPHRPYAEQLFLNDIRDLSHRLLHFDSLSGTNRLLLAKDTSKSIRNEIRSSMVISNELIVGPAKKIAALLAGPNAGYFAIDARLDGKLEKSAGTNMRSAWWELGRRQGISEVDLEHAERGVWTRSPAWRIAVSESSYGPYLDPPDRPHDPVLQDALAVRPKVRSTGSGIPCPRLLHSKTTLLPLNTPLFLSTSTTNPQDHAALRLLHSTYPCLFTLDTPEIRKIVDGTLKKRLVNKLDEYEMSGWIEKWIGLEVAARAREVVGTNGTAWSKWAEEVVQPIAKG